MLINLRLAQAMLVTQQALAFYRSLIMNTVAQTNPSMIEKAEFVDILSGEFTVSKGFGVYAFLSFRDIDDLYNDFQHKAVSAKVFIKFFVRNF